MSDLPKIAAAIYRQLADTGQPVRYQWDELTVLLRLNHDRSRYELVVLGNRQPYPDERAALLQAFRIPRDARQYEETFKRDQQVTRWTWPKPKTAQLPLI